MLVIILSLGRVRKIFSLRTRKPLIDQHWATAFANRWFANPTKSMGQFLAQDRFLWVRKMKLLLTGYVCPLSDCRKLATAHVYVTATAYSPALAHRHAVS